MANLSLPKMTYATLSAKIGNALEKGITKINIAYQTSIERQGDNTIIVRHHNNAIAQIARDWFILDNAGWHSVTTANRLNQILKDNQTVLPSDPKVTDRLWYFVHIKNGRMLLSGRNAAGETKVLSEFDYHVAHFSRVNSDRHFVWHSSR